MNEHKHSAICDFPGWKTIKRTQNFILLLLKCKTRENSLRGPKCFELDLHITVSGFQETEFASAIIMFLGDSVQAVSSLFQYLLNKWDLNFMNISIEKSWVTFLYLLSDCWKLHHVESFVKRGSAHIYVHNHGSASFAAKKSLKQTRQLALTERDD